MMCLCTMKFQYDQGLPMQIIKNVKMVCVNHRADFLKSLAKSDQQMLQTLPHRRHMQFKAHLVIMSLWAVEKCDGSMDQGC